MPQIHTLHITPHSHYHAINTPHTIATSLIRHWPPRINTPLRCRHYATPRHWLPPAINNSCAPPGQRGVISQPRQPLIAAIHARLRHYAASLIHYARILLIIATTPIIRAILIRQPPEGHYWRHVRHYTRYASIHCHCYAS